MNPPYTTILVEAGEIRVNAFYIETKSENVVALYGDLHSKRAAIDGHCNGDNGPGICLSATSETLHTDENAKGHLTFVYFPEFKGWRVHCADVGRYTVAVCLVKDRIEE